MSGRASTPPGRRSRRPYLVVVGWFWVLPLVALLIGYLTLSDRNASGQCEGIGFGCTLAPRDGLLFLAMLGYPFIFVAGLLIIGVIAGVRAHRDRH